MTTAPRVSTRLFTLAVTTGVVFFHAVSAHADTITHFSSSTSFVQATSTGFSTSPTYLERTVASNGLFVETSRSFDVSEGLGEAYGAADLSSGDLRTYADAEASGDGGFLASFARADFGDSFTTFEDDSPFAWTSATEATFTLDVSGLVDLHDAGNGSAVGLTIFESGALDAYARWLNGEDTFDLWNSRVITSFAYALGPDADTFPGITGTLSSYPTTISATFTPGSDFDWAITLSSFIYINGSFAAADAYGRADFANTVSVSYDGPAGTTTYSGSGAFPGTQSLATAPEPATMLMLLTGAGVLAVVRRRQL